MGNRYVIALRGVQTEKRVERRQKQVIPFVGANRKGDDASMGVGIIFPEDQKSLIWGLWLPHLVIRSWRGMKLLERLERINSGTLFACWTVMNHDLLDCDKYLLKKLAKQVGDANDLGAIRDELLASGPSRDELDSMLKKFRENGVHVGCWELREEIKAGRIASSPLIKTLIREENEYLKALRQEEKEICKRLPSEQSLSVFFKELGISNLMIGIMLGFRLGRRIGLNELDEIAKRDSFRDPKGHELKQVSTGIRDFEPPQYIAQDRTKYTFRFARYRDGRFHIQTKIKRERTKAIEGEYTISELRSMIKRT